MLSRRASFSGLRFSCLVALVALVGVLTLGPALLSDNLATLGDLGAVFARSGKGDLDARGRVTRRSSTSAHRRSSTSAHRRVGTARRGPNFVRGHVRRRPHRRGRRGRHAFARKSGHAVGKSRLRVTPLERPSGSLWVYSENLHEEIRVQLYDDQGEFDDAALAKLDHEFRCKRTKEERAVDPRLYEMLSRIQDHFEGRRILLVSGFRFQRNEGSRHYHASAMDIRIPGVATSKVRAFVATLDAGGMGIGMYPRSNFVHVDFRAPGEASYRWTDYSRPGGTSRGKRRSRRAKHRRASNT